MNEEVKTILIVDDDEINRRAYSEMLEIVAFASFPPVMALKQSKSLKNTPTKFN